MTREKIINEIKPILDELSYPDAVSYLTQNDVKWLNEIIKKLEQKPCEDAVRRTEVIDELNRLGRNAFKDDTDYDNFFAFLDNLQPITPMRKVGKWEYVGDNCFKCTECGEVYTMNQFNDINNYCDSRFPKGCPNCGVEMREVEE